MRISCQGHRGCHRCDCVGAVTAVVVGVSHQPSAGDCVTSRVLLGSGPHLAQPELLPLLDHPSPNCGWAHIKPVRYEMLPYLGQGL